MARKRRWDPRLVLAAGLASLSFAAILVRYARAPALAIAFWRMALASLLLLPFHLAARKEPQEPGGRALWPFTLGAGLILALHFTCWIASIQLTTVAASLLLMSAQPLWAALLGLLFLKEAVPRRGAAGMGLALLGIAAIAWSDRSHGTSSLLGDSLALLSGLAAAGYLTVGRHLRLRLPLPTYLVSVYGASALFLGLAALLAGVPFTGFDGRTWAMFGLLALFPSALGHSLVNYALRHMESYRVSLSILVEPVVSSLLAALLFAEVPGAAFFPGALLIFAGVFLAMGRSAPPP
ncbi:MAG: DMT family transporter [Acidobacteriota bacterium]